MKIAIANDCSLQTAAIQALLREDPFYRVIWVAHNGLQAVQMCQSERPDLILMDIAMPVMNGIEATKIIMKNTPCAILIVTGMTTGETSQIFEAMGYGALDVVAMTSHVAVCPRHEAADLLRKIATISRLQGRQRNRDVSGILTAKYLPNGQPYPNLVAIGASTGGPVAIAQLLQRLPLESSLAIVIIQHVDAKFTSGFAKWLQSHTAYPVSLAAKGECPKAGQVLVAGYNKHLVVMDNGALNYVATPHDVPYRPSIDIFFHSLAEHWSPRSIAVLLTGMGADGARGLKALKERGWHTIAEHENSCVIYGMPRAAIEIGAACQVLHREDIPPAILIAKAALERKEGF